MCSAHVQRFAVVQAALRLIRQARPNDGLGGTLSVKAGSLFSTPALKSHTSPESQLTCWHPHGQPIASAFVGHYALFIY
jgi:hypothetical protein